MKKLLAVLSVAALLSPALAFAAYDTVSLATSVALNVGGIEVDVSGSTAAIESIIVYSSSFTVGLQSGSSIKVSAPSLNRLDTDTSPDITQSACSGTDSSITYVATAARTVTITPSASLCVSSGGSGGGSGGSSSGGGGGSVVTTTTTTDTSSTAATTTTTPTTTTTTPTTTTTTTSASSGLSSSQINSILGVLGSFGADSATIANVQEALSGSTSASSASEESSFTRNLTIGAVSDDVRALQHYLNTHGFVVATSGTGSLGHETTKFGLATKTALIKYQKANNITPASGYFGAKTRAAINAGK